MASDLHLSSRAYTRRRAAFDLRAHRETAADIEFVWLPALRYRGNNWRRAASMLSFAVRTFIYLLVQPRERQEVVIGSSPHLLGAFAALLAAQLRRVPFVLEVRDLWPETFVGMTGRTSGVDVALMRWIADQLYQHADSIIVLAADSEQVVKARGAHCSIWYVPNSVDLSTFEEPVAIGRSRSPFRFVYAGAHGPANGLDVVVRACLVLQMMGRSDIQVHLIGDGPEKPNLQALAQSLGVNNVLFGASVPKVDMPALLQEFDAGLMLLADVPLFRIGVSPNKLFDYLAASLPIVNNVPGYVERVVNEARSGITCAPGDPESLAQTMAIMVDQLRQDHDRYRNGREYIARHYERRKLTDSLVELLDEVCTRGA